jgi:hypothetical protein
MSTGSQRDYGPLWSRWIPPRARDIFYRARARRIESEHLREFQRFYAALPDRKEIFYMFFTSGLLQWAARTTSFVPQDVNLVLVGSDLDQDEIAWIRENLRRPFHHLRLHVDDRAMWEFLFATNRHNFGWLDVDCFVLQPGLFAEMTSIEPKTVASSIWSFKAPGGIDMLSTFFVFLNVDAIAAVRSRIAVSPDAYSHELIRRPGSPYAFTKLLAPTHRSWLKKVLPTDQNGQPVYVNGDGYFDTLQVYQLISNALGFQVKRVRPLTLGEQLSSNEALHIGKVSYYRRYRTRSETELQKLYALLLRADFVLLSEMQGKLPRAYDQLWIRIKSEIEELGIGAGVDEIKETICQEMVCWGASESSIRRVMAGQDR